MVFKNEKQLENFLLAKCKNAVISVETKVHQIIDSCLKQFYSEFDPDQYIRTEQLLHSLVKSGVKSTNNGFEAEVYFDASMLNYTTGSWSGETVLNVAMKSDVPHGGYVGGTAVWTASRELLGDIFKLLEQALKEQGVPVVKG